jgi:hypothetical protein
MSKDNEGHQRFTAVYLAVCLNDHARWCRVPAAAWDYQIGGFHVLRKWLSYREK